MDYRMGTDAQGRLGEFFAGIGEVLGNKTRRASFATYFFGLLSDGERKSMEPIAARACADPGEVDAQHQRLGHFLTDSPWSDREMRRFAARYGLAAMTEREAVEAWIIDDTGFLKQGRHSVGVQRQYTGSAGKIANCQLGVSLSMTTPIEHIPVDFELYLPKSWMEDLARREEARIPDSLIFKTKIDLAIEMLQRAVEDDLPRGILLADSFYGDEPKFRSAARALGLQYAVGVHSDNRVWRLDKAGRRRGEPITVARIARQIGSKSFRRITWKQGTKTPLWARFALQRVTPAYKSTDDDPARESVWLLIEWPPGESEATKFYFATLPTQISRKHLVRIVKERWRTERVYEDLKGELGLDHFEGRRFSGWHHHVSVALCCFAFVAAERSRAFPPSAPWKPQTVALRLSA